MVDLLDEKGNRAVLDEALGQKIPVTIFDSVAQPSIGDSWVLPPIAAALIGGVATTGGVGSPVGAIFGAAIIGAIENIIVLFGVSPYWQSVVSGAIVVLAISFDSISRRTFRREE